MKLRLGILGWILTLLITSSVSVKAISYDLSAYAFREVSVVYNGTQSEFVCLGPGAWTASGDSHTENWTVRNTDGSLAWQDAPIDGLWSAFYLNYQIRTPSNCNNPSGLVSNSFGVYPTGLYGAFVFFSDNQSEWNHRVLERPVRSLPLGWTISGTLD